MSEFAPLLVKLKRGGTLAGYYSSGRYYGVLGFMAAAAAASVADSSHVPGLNGLAYFWFGVSFQSVVNRVVAGGQPPDMTGPQ